MPPKRVQRLGSLSRSTPGQRSKQAPRQPPARKHACCNDPKIEDDGEGHLVCKNCYTQVDESNIVADVTFAEDSRGAATVQGGFVGESARHARGSAALRRHGGADKDSFQDIEANGRRGLSSLCTKLGIPETTLNQALRLYTLAAYHQNFAAGRRTDEVIGVCLYTVCRRQKDNAVLLIDIAELLQINVFRLGEVYKTLCAELYLDQATAGVGTQYLVEVESLVMKYCRRLEFGDATRQVAEDAVRIIRRMKRDWIVTGRHPAGLCGAAIILAARMNNFRRSIREIVYVAKVADFTVWKRVEEFRKTKSAALTVDEFRTYGVRLKHQHDPPVLYESELKKQKFEEKKRKRLADGEARETIEISDDGSNASSRESSAAAAPTPTPEPSADQSPPSKRRRTSNGQQPTPAPTQQEVRRDADGFVIPAIPVDLTATANGDEEPPKRKRGRPRKEIPEPIVITDEELATEAELEFDINSALNDQEIVDSRNELEKAKDEERAKALAEQKKKEDEDNTRSRREEQGITWLDDNEFSMREEVTAEDLEAEFADDPEVQNCQLSAEEQQIKEQIWIRENEDWLRSQQEKAMMKAVADTTKRNKDGRVRKKPVKKKRKGQMGDGTTLAEATTPIETPADANIAMLEARASPRLSKFINYDALRRVYKPTHSSPSASLSRGSTTPNGSQTSPDRATVEQAGSMSPTPLTSRIQFQSPPATQSGSSVAAVSRPSAREPVVPMSPPETQAQPQATAGAEEESDEDDYVQDEALDYGSDDGGSPMGWGEEDEREDIGEDDYRRAIDPTGNVAIEEAFDEYDY